MLVPQLFVSDFIHLCTSCSYGSASCSLLTIVVTTLVSDTIIITCASIPFLQISWMALKIRVTFLKFCVINVPWRETERERNEQIIEECLLVAGKDTHMNYWTLFGWGGTATLFVRVICIRGVFAMSKSKHHTLLIVWFTRLARQPFIMGAPRRRGRRQTIRIMWNFNTSHL